MMENTKSPPTIQPREEGDELDPNKFLKETEDVLGDDQKKPMKKILVGVPCLEGSVPIELVSAILAVEGAGTKFQLGYAFVKRAMVHLARNTILKSAVEGGYDYVFFWDNDNPPEKKDFILTLFNDIEESNGEKSIVSGVYTMRQPPYKSCIFDEVIEEGGFVNYQHKKFMDLSKGIIQEVGNIPTGCVLMTIEVVKAMLEKYAGDPFECKNVTYIKHDGLRDELSPEIISELNGKLEYCIMQRGEDLLFFERCKKMGYKLRVDTRVLMGHLSDPANVKVPKEFFTGGELINTLEEECSRQTLPVQFGGER